MKMKMNGFVWGGVLFLAAMAAWGGKLGEGLTHYYDFEEGRVSDAGAGGTTFEIRCQEWDAGLSGLREKAGAELVSKCAAGGGLGEASPPKDGFGAAYSGGPAGSSARIYGAPARFLCPAGEHWTVSLWAMRQKSGDQPRLLVNGVPIGSDTAEALSAPSGENVGFGFYALKHNVNEMCRFGVRLSEESGGVFTVKSILSAQPFACRAGEGGWHNVMLIRDGTNLTLYVDGTAQGVAGLAEGSSVTVPEGGLLYTAKRDEGQGAQYALDDVAVWGRALTGEERAAVAEGVRPVSAMAGSAARSAAGPGARPNVVVIMADDLGFGDVSCNTNCVPTFRCCVDTPNIDRLARGGLRFNSGYCSASTCTPTRYSLITGNYAFRREDMRIAPPDAPARIFPGTETVASLMKKAGYATAVIGKWHLGLGWGAPDWNNELTPGPLDIGFDTCLLLPTTNDRVPQVFVKDRRVQGLDPSDPIRLIATNKPPSPALCFYHNIPKGSKEWKAIKVHPAGGHDETVHNGIPRIGYYTGGEAARFKDEDLASNWVAAADAFIGAHADTNFFLLVTPHDIHVPRIPAPCFTNKSALGPRGEMILEFDWTVGKVVDSIEAHGLASNTLVIMLSDNGPVGGDGYSDGANAKLNETGHQMRGPFRGSSNSWDWGPAASGKYSVYEGGTRIPLITYWPGRIAPGGVSDEVVCSIDLAASLAGLVNAPIAANGCLDSQDVMGALLGDSGAKGRESLILQDNRSACAIRDGDWRLVNGSQLYNLRDDPGERENLASEYPLKAAELRTKQDRMIAAGRTRPAPPPPGYIALSTESKYGAMVPAEGVRNYPAGTEVTVSVSPGEALPAGSGAGVRAECTGWTGETNGVAASGAGTSVTFPLTAASSIVWEWREEYHLTFEAGEGGTVDAASGWFDAGDGPAVITAAPDAKYRFESWAGDTNGCAMEGAVITVPPGRARTIRANFFDTTQPPPPELPLVWDGGADGGGVWRNNRGGGWRTSDGIPTNWLNGAEALFTNAAAEAVTAGIVEAGVKARAVRFAGAGPVTIAGDGALTMTGEALLTATNAGVGTVTIAARLEGRDGLTVYAPDTEGGFVIGKPAVFTGDLSLEAGRLGFGPGGRLGENGTFAGAVTLAAGAILEPPPGKQTFGGAVSGAGKVLVKNAAGGDIAKAFFQGGALFTGGLTVGTNGFVQEISDKKPLPKTGTVEAVDGGEIYLPCKGPDYTNPFHIRNGGVLRLNHKLALRGNHTHDGRPVFLDNGKVKLDTSCLIYQLDVTNGGTVYGKPAWMNDSWREHTITVHGDAPLMYPAGYTWNSISGDSRTLTLDVEDAAGRMVMSGPVTGNACGRTIIKRGAGTVVFQGKNTYINCTTRIDAGTLRFETDHAMGAEGNVIVLNGGALDLGTGDNTGGAGALKVTGDSTLKLGGGAIAFAASTEGWTAGKVLTIEGALAGDRVRFGTGSGGLTDGQLGQIRLADDPGAELVLDPGGWLRKTGSSGAAAVLTVASAHGTADPPAGTRGYAAGASVPASAGASPVESGGVRYVCTGWTGATNGVAASGEGTSVTFTITSDSSITWNWEARAYYLTIEAGPGGTADAASGWRDAGESVTILAATNAGYVFAGWTGDTGGDGCAVNGEALTVKMDRARAVRANFREETPPEPPPEPPAGALVWNGGEAGASGGAGAGVWRAGGSGWLTADGLETNWVNGAEAVFSAAAAVTAEIDAAGVEAKGVRFDGAGPVTIAGAGALTMTGEALLVATNAVGTVTIAARLEGGDGLTVYAPDAEGEFVIGKPAAFTGGLSLEAGRLGFGPEGRLGENGTFEGEVELAAGTVLEAPPGSQTFGGAVSGQGKVLVKSAAGGARAEASFANAQWTGGLTVETNGFVEAKVAKGIPVKGLIEVLDGGEIKLSAKGDNVKQDPIYVRNGGVLTLGQKEALDCGWSAGNRRKVILEGGIIKTLIDNRSYTPIIWKLDVGNGGGTIEGVPIRTGDLNHDITFIVNGNAPLLQKAGHVWANAVNFTMDVADVTGDEEGDMIISGPITGNAIDKGNIKSLIKKGAGTVVFSGENTYANCTTRIEAGTLRFETDHAMGTDNNVIVLNGGVLDLGTGDNTEPGIGSLKLTGDSTLKISGGKIKFAALPEGWTGKLTINGALPERTVRFGEDGSGLTKEQLGQMIQLDPEDDGKELRITPGGWLSTEPGGTVILLR